ncbi:MAG: hypothetical protein GY696_11975 [Gammaproteobacteria bacterium]|nr:hypothetical protein [Gammaproteobacteria bacterium]
MRPRAPARVWGRLHFCGEAAPSYILAAKPRQGYGPSPNCREPPAAPPPPGYGIGCSK